MNKMNQEVFVVVALRWGSNENHSYNIGVYTDLEEAKKVANQHDRDRGGKYVCEVEKGVLNGNMDPGAVYSSADMVDDTWKLEDSICDWKKDRCYALHFEVYDEIDSLVNSPGTYKD
jgi:hypothetical protein